MNNDEKIGKITNIIHEDDQCGYDGLLTEKIYEIYTEKYNRIAKIINNEI